ncbi:2-dehydro-3-deoxygalactonokinase [Deinococcus peraridilitoris]|uniref:2-keto-3-deoxy-galactonokinase n=1 Tax=Deinococcus peraridilitoris (strain DSM 19664 / LMG 22246 / CIP 109416 / KR-200) TaxID=937777 RepID=L0A7Q3_DEIPD|nr:2-dehydro-3-deoxygalactonokinase [Deinococcus peraridilitoris]AFZ69474.1 2-keto-3-deoxy-galactonokinase [Deinococcus peraridilitoris DSM 19664]
MIALLDSGTTRTRLRLWDQNHVVWHGERQVGSADVARAGVNHQLRAAIAELLSEARRTGSITTIIASGMISSNVGLLEVPQLHAPLTYEALATSLMLHHFTDLGEVLFVPGVRTLPSTLSLDDLAQADVMRGEETEVVGLRRLLSLSGNVTFMHYGSHHKLVWTDDQGIHASRTNLNGELLAAISMHTILRSSVPPLDTFHEVNDHWWHQGLNASVQHGFSRACFMVRLADQFLKATPQDAASFLLGAIASLDLSLLMGQPHLVLYGRSTMTLPMQRYLQARGQQVDVADETTTQQAAIAGALHLHEQYTSRKE